MCVTVRFADREKLLQFREGKMPFHILLIVHHARAERLLMRLSLEDLLFNSSRLLRKQFHEFKRSKLLNRSNKQKIV